MLIYHYKNFKKMHLLIDAFFEIYNLKCYTLGAVIDIVISIMLLV